MQLFVDIIRVMFYKSKYHEYLKRLDTKKWPFSDLLANEKLLQGTSIES